MNKGLISIICLILTAPVFGAQYCNPNIPATTPTADFEFQAGGIVKHLETGLTWKRCVEGLVFNDAGTPDDYSDDSCDSQSTDRYTWQDALQIANNAGNNWRLPNYKELKSIIEYQCNFPALNASVFPNLPPYPAWSSSALLSNPTVDNRAWVVSLANGTDGRNDRNSLNRVLLVKDSPS